MDVEILGEEVVEVGAEVEIPEVISKVKAAEEKENSIPVPLTVIIVAEEDILLASAHHRNSNIETRPTKLMSNLRTQREVNHPMIIGDRGQRIKR